MRSRESDLTARASIRNAALALFAEHGPGAVSVRQIATTAGVSPALVLHHFGSKAGLREAVDEHVAGVFDELFDAGSTDDALPALADGDAGSIAQLFAQTFPPDSPLPAYLRRLLLSGDPAGTRLFQSWYDATQALFDQMVRAGLATPGGDPAVRSAFALANDLALILLRGPLEHVLGFDPLTPAGIDRWAREVTAVYRDGLWGAAATPSARK
jgi:AcrR family transcriptional regulator